MKPVRSVVRRFPRLRLLWMTGYVWADVGLSGSARQRRKARRLIERDGYSLQRTRRPGQANFSLSDMRA